MFLKKASVNRGQLIIINKFLKLLLFMKYLINPDKFINKTT